MIFALFIVFYLPFSLSFIDKNGLFPTRTAFDDFIDVLKTSDDCIDMYRFTVVTLNHRNHSKHFGLIQKELFEKYIQMRNDGLSDSTIEPLLNIYCRAKTAVPLVLNTWTPPLGLIGNFTWNLTDDTRENDDYHLAKHKENVFLEIYERERKMKTSPSLETSEPLNMTTDIKQVLRGCAITLIVSLALSVHNLIRRYYEEDDDPFEQEERLGIFGELILMSVLVFSFICVLILLYDSE